MLCGICRIHFNLMFAARMTALYFSDSAAMKAAKVAGEPGMTIPPSPATRVRIPGSASPAFISVFRRVMIAGGVPRGVPMPNHEPASYPGTKSLIGGTLGSAAERLDVVTARGFNLPLLINPMLEGIGSNIAWPVRRVQLPVLVLIQRKARG